MAEYNGGFQSYADRVTKDIFFRAEGRATSVVTVKQGQVLKALSFVETDAQGKAIAHTGLVESALVTINGALAAAATLTVGTTGIVFTVGSGGASKEQLVNAMAVLTTGMSTTNANIALLAAGIATTVGTYTSGTGPAFNFAKIDADTVVANSSAAGDVTNLAVAASAGTAPTVTIKAGASSISKIAGVLVYDVNATSADVKAPVYKEASFWGDALTWAVDAGADTVTNPDGTTTAVTAYNTGCAGSTPEAILLKKKFIEGSEFEPLGFRNAGDYI